MKDGKRLKGWLAKKMGQSPEQKAHKKRLKQVREDAFMLGQVAGARREGYKEGVRSQRGGGGGGGFLGKLQAGATRHKSAMNVIFGPDPLGGIGEPPKRKRKKRKRRKKR